MNIIKATKAALKHGKGITNTELKQIKAYLLPTNLCLGFIIVHTEYEYLDDKKPAPRWQPQAKDILATDWELWGQLPGIILNETHKQHYQLRMYIL